MRSRLARPRRGMRAFTLVELIVVLLVLGILAAIAVTGYSVVIRQARISAAQTNLHNVATAVLVEATLTDAPRLDRPLFMAALGEHFNATVTDGIGAQQTLRLGLASESPRTVWDYSVGFDHFDEVVTDDGGPRAAVVTAVGDEVSYARIIIWRDGNSDSADATTQTEWEGLVPAGTTPAQVLVEDFADVPPNGSTPPPAPGGGSGDAGGSGTVMTSAVDGGLVVSWSGAAGASSYVATAVGSGGTASGTCTTTGTTCTISGLVNGSSYQVSVTTVLTGGATSVSAPVTAVPSSGGFMVAPASTDTSAHAGESVAIHGDLAVLGAPGASQAPLVNNGAVLSFARSTDGWVPAGRLTAADAHTGDSFGRAVAFDGTTLVVGASHDDDRATDAGSAYVFTRSSGAWVLEAKLTASDAAVSDLFGSAVAVAGDTIAVGAFMDDNGGVTDRGAVYIFNRTSGAWTQTTKLTGPTGSTAQNFGSKLSMDADTLAVVHAGAGAVDVYTHAGTTWSSPAVLKGPAGHTFGYSAAVSGDTLLVGAPYSKTVFVMTRTNGVWSEQARLTTADTTANEFFGLDVALSGDRAVIGSRQADPQGTDSGAAFTATRDAGAWGAPVRRADSRIGAGAWFGNSVAVDGTAAIVGAPRWQSPQFTGAALLFDVP